MERKNYRQNAVGNKIDGNKKRRRTSACCANHGYVLVFSLWAIVIFGFIALNFTRNTGIAIKTEKSYVERIQSVYAARGACLYAIKMLLLSEKQNKQKSKKQNIGNEIEFKTEEPWTPSKRLYSAEIGDKECEILITDESGKININKITDKTKNGFIRFLMTVGIKEHDAEIITDSILDWMDEDDLHHVNGAEKSYYESLPEPYEPKNGSFEFIEELTLVRGVTPEIYELLSSYVTIYGGEKINVNFAPEEVFYYILEMRPETIDAFVEYRDEKGKIKNIKKLKKFFRDVGVVGSEFQDIVQYLDVSDSNYLSIESFSDSDTDQSPYKIIVRKDANIFRIIAVYPG